jgi:hypothetical protein
MPASLDPDKPARTAAGSFFQQFRQGAFFSGEKG